MLGDDFANQYYSFGTHQEIPDHRFVFFILTMAGKESRYCSDDDGGFLEVGRALFRARG
ncbi:hypothetical protein CEXT_189321, partial [Caerostris extrusa]